MSKFMMKMNQDRCISCRACELHCKLSNKVPGDAKLGQLTTVGPLGRAGKAPKIMNQFLTCFHCAQPWCTVACPTGAMQKREDGIVFVDPDLCVGCKACIIACPWKVPQWDETAGKAIKCDYCKDRLDAGKLPACVTACCGHALEFVRPNQESSKTREEYSRKVLLKKAKTA
jgi:Fe-S-cluster-containing dehydrogenase component